MGDLQEQIDDLVRALKAHRDDIDALGGRADAAETRADAAEMRADAAELRANVSEAHAQYADRRADVSEAKAKVDREIIAELQRDGRLAREHAAHQAKALKSSRTVGTAIGVLMASRQISEVDAFEILKVASQNSNRKLREIAAELVESAGSVLPD